MRRSLLVPLSFGVLAWVFAAPASPVRADGALVGKVEAAAKERGGEGEPLAKRSGKLRKDHPLRTSLSLPKGTCLVAALGVSAGEASLGLRTLVADLVDADVGDLARIRYCAADADEKVELSAESTERSAFAIVALRVGQEEPPKPVQAAPEPAPGPPVESLSARLAKLTQGYEPMAPPREEDLSEGDPRKRELVLEAGRCYRVFAAAELAAGQVELLLRNVRGSGLRALGKVPLGPGSTARTGLVCPEQTENHVLEIRLRNGTGLVLWQLVGTDNPEISKRWHVGGTGDALVQRRMRAERKLLDADKLPAMAFVQGELKTAEQAEAKFSAVAGRCYAAMAVGVPSLRSLELELSDQRGGVVAQVQGNSTARAQACASVAGEWTVRVRAFKGYGSYGLQVFGGSED
jgi:hypothetical protein